MPCPYRRPPAKMPLLEDLLTALTGGDDDRAEAAVLPLTQLGQAALPALERLTRAEDPDHRWWALRCLAQFPDPPSQPFIEALSDPQVEIRQCAALGLSHHPTPAALTALSAALQDPDSMVVTLAANGLAALGADAVPALTEALSGRSSVARLEAVRALGVIGDPRAIPALMQAIQQDSALMAYWAAQGLDKLGLGMVYLKPD